MPYHATALARHRATILATALRETVADLRLIEPRAFVDHIRAGRWADLADLVHSSAELYFQEGALTFACSATFAYGRAGEDAGDGASDPSVALEMEFQGDSISAFFTLSLDRHEGMVALRYVWFPREPDSAAAGTAALAQAVAETRLGLGSMASLSTR